MSPVWIRVSILAVAVLVLLVLGLRAITHRQGTPGATVVLRNINGLVIGMAMLSEPGDGRVYVDVTVELNELATGPHGTHVHPNGVCDSVGDAPFPSAGGHYNPTGAKHGGPPSMGAPEATTTMPTPRAMVGHAGDLGIILIGRNGAGSPQIATDRFGLAELNDADGSALVIHDGGDDLQDDPNGKSGGRIVCGVIAPPQHGATTMATPSV